MAHKDTLDHNLSILSSLLYSKGELKKAAFEKAEFFMSLTIHALFEDMKKDNIFGNNMEEVTYILDAVSNMAPGDLQELLQVIESIDKQENRNRFANLN